MRVADTRRHTPSMKPSRSLIGPSLLKLVCAALLLGGAAQARNEACDTAPNRASGTCVARVAAVGGATLAVYQPDRHMEAGVAAKPTTSPDAEPAPASSPGEPPLLGLLLAALGVVAFVAQRRGGR